MSIHISTLNINVCQCRSRVSHMTAPAGALTCFTYELLEFASSTLLFVRAAIFLSTLLLPGTSTSRPNTSMNRDNEVALFSAATAICLLNFHLSVGAVPTALIQFARRYRPSRHDTCHFAWRFQGFPQKDRVVQAFCGHSPLCSTFSKNSTISPPISFGKSKGTFGCFALHNPTLPHIPSIHHFSMVSSSPCQCFAHSFLASSSRICTHPPHRWLCDLVEKYSTHFRTPNYLLHLSVTDLLHLFLLIFLLRMLLSFVPFLHGILPSCAHQRFGPILSNGRTVDCARALLGTRLLSQRISTMTASSHKKSRRSTSMCFMSASLIGLCWSWVKSVRGVSWSEVATVPKRKSHRGLDLNLSWNSEEDI